MVFNKAAEMGEKEKAGQSCPHYSQAGQSPFSGGSGFLDWASLLPCPCYPKRL